jgi:hypothetical protein
MHRLFTTSLTWILQIAEFFTIHAANAEDGFKVVENRKLKLQRDHARPIRSPAFHKKDFATAMAAMLLFLRAND